MRNIVFVMLMLLCLAATAAPAGSPPRNLRVTGVTDWVVGLRWDAPSGKAPASYVVQCSNGHTITVPGSQTSASFSSGFDYNRTYSFRAYAVANGSWSGASNSVSATLLKDTTPPTKPVVQSNGVGPTHVDLSWACSDASPNLRFDVYVNGQLWFGQVAGNTKRVVMLQPNTTYSFQVRARDSGGNWSQMSNPFVVTTPAADPNDLTPPSMPPGLNAWVFQDGEAMFFWGDSADNVTSQDFIRYDVYLNGVYEGSLVGDEYAHQFTLYLALGVVNTIEVFAIDEAGNRSAPATMTVDLR